MTDARIDSINNPKSATIEAFRREVDSWKDPISRFAERIADKIIPTNTPSKAYKRASSKGGEWRWNYSSGERYWKGRK